MGNRDPQGRAGSDISEPGAAEVASKITSHAHAGGQPVRPIPTPRARWYGRENAVL